MNDLEGTIEQVVYYSPDTGYTVCRFLTDGGQSLTIIGNFPPFSPGEVLRIKGKWELNPKFGKQFRVENFIPVLPSSVKGIEKFLSCGLIKGIGPVLARRIVRRFSSKTIKIISENPDRLKEVEGVGSVKLNEIKRSWAEHEDIRGLVIFLQEYDISTTLATKIYKNYGKNSFQVLKTNPYQVSHDIWGIGFKTADQIALKLGISPDSPQRIKAFIHYLLQKDNEYGHIFSLKKDLEKQCFKELRVENEDFLEALDSLERERLIVTEKVNSDMAVYLPFFYQAQEEVVHSLIKLSKFPFPTPDFDVHKAIQNAESELGIKFSPAQKLAIRESFFKKTLVITGGPGTGKTTIVKAIVDIFHKWGRRVLLAAPTGRAAKRLSEATGREAKTIHRILEYNPKSGSFKRGENYPLSGDGLIIDEFSMVDLPLMHNLLKAVPQWMQLILVGDKDQIPSVGPGNLLRDIIESQKVEVVRLEEIFRQEKDSLIVHNAHRVNRGESLIYPKKDDKNSDFYFIHQENVEKAFRIIMNLCCYRIPDKLHLSAISPHIQVISPMYRGILGVDNLNAELQKKLNPCREGIKFGSKEIRIGDKVMQVKNSYEKEVFNGDIGTVSGVDKHDYRLFVNFEGRIVVYEKEEINEIVLAYAVSVHKSQGSEYQAVVMPLMTQHFIMLQRNLFYTALTRAKKLSVIVGSYKAIYIAIKNDMPIKRNSLVKEKLMKLENPPLV